MSAVSRQLLAAAALAGIGEAVLHGTPIPTFLAPQLATDAAGMRVGGRYPATERGDFAVHRTS